jgi:hypothetical protein
VAVARPVQVTFDSADPHRLAAWWSSLLGYEIEDNHEVVSQMLEDGVIGENEVVPIGGRLFFADAAAARDPEGRGPRLYFERVPEPKTVKNRMHIDVPVGAAALDDEVDRVVGMGAQLVEFRSHPGERWAVLRDPEGNEFCLQ